MKALGLAWLLLGAVPPVYGADSPLPKECFRVHLRFDDKATAALRKAKSPPELHLDLMVKGRWYTAFTKALSRRERELTVTETCIGLPDTEIISLSPSIPAAPSVACTLVPPAPIQARRGQILETLCRG